MRCRTLFIIVCLLGFCLLGIGAATAEQEVDLTADSLVFDREQGEVRAEGAVRLQRGETVLRADRVRYVEASGEVFCDGKVEMAAPLGEVSAASLQYNFQTGRGRMTDGRVEVPGQAYLSGAEIETLGNDNYRIVDGHFTSCEGETPSWSFGASEIDVRLGRFAEARHAKFYVRDVPVMYLPYVAIPAKTERSSGFLMPSVGFSSQLGTRLVLPWHQVLDDHQDMTFTLDSMTEIGFGTGVEYRYFMYTHTPARANINYVTGTNGQPDRYLLEWDHDGYLPGSTRLAVAAQYVNKNDYFELFGGSPAEYTSDKVESKLYLSKSWDKTSLAGQTLYTRALQQPTQTVLQTLPEVRLSYLPQRLLKTALYTSLELEASNFWRHQGETGTRFRLSPGLSTDLLSSRYLNVLPAAAWQEHLYQLGGSLHRVGRPEASLTVGNRLSRVYGDATTQAATRHAIELQLNYLYAPAVDFASNPQFDLRDDFAAVNRLRLFVGNRWTGRRYDVDGTAIYRDLVNLRLLLDYDLHEQRRSLGPAPDERRPFSPLMTEIELRPHERVYLRGDFDFDIDSSPGRLEAAELWGGVRDRGGNGLLVNYSYQRADFDYLGVSADLGLLDPVHLNYEGRFDLRGRQNLDYRTSVEYRSGCWSVAGHWYERPGDRSVSVSFSLSNITGQPLRPLTTDLVDWF